eukprot:5647187-Prymnesium_polylepis.1
MPMRHAPCAMCRVPSRARSRGGTRLRDAAEDEREHVEANLEDAVGRERHRFDVRDERVRQLVREQRGERRHGADGLSARLHRNLQQRQPKLAHVGRVGRLCRVDERDEEARHLVERADAIRHRRRAARAAAAARRQSEGGGRSA